MTSKNGINSQAILSLSGRHHQGPEAEAAALREENKYLREQISQYRLTADKALRAAQRQRGL
jgi:hypothetical protein